MDDHVAAVRSDVAEMKGGVKVAQFLLGGLLVIVVGIATWGLVKAEEADTRSIKNERVLDLLLPALRKGDHGY
jgi:hypothetical protein